MTRELSSVGEVVAKLGGNKHVARLFGFGPNAVSNWRKKGLFPPETFIVMTTALAQCGCVADPKLWRMRRPVPARGGNHARKAAF